MPNPVVIYLIVAIGAFVIGMIALSRHLEKQRTAKLREVASGIGLDFSEQGDAAVRDRLAVFPLFQVGRGRKIRNMIFGETDQLQLAMFDYQYTTGSGKHQHTSKQTVVALEGPSLDLPEFEMKPEHLFHKIGGMLGLKDIDFDSHPKFSKMFHLKGPVESSIRQMFHPEVLSLLEQRPGLYIQGRGQRLIYFRSKHRVKPEQYKDLMAEAFQLYELWNVGEALAG